MVLARFAADPATSGCSSALRRVPAFFAGAFFADAFLVGAFVVAFLSGWLHAAPAPPAAPAMDPQSISSCDGRWCVDVCDGCPLGKLKERKYSCRATMGVVELPYLAIGSQQLVTFAEAAIVVAVLAVPSCGVGQGLSVFLWGLIQATQWQNKEQ